jgi:hypothetical protein
MGLDIEDYSYSYSRLHALREWAHEIVGKSKMKYRCEGSFIRENCGKCICCFIDKNGALLASKKTKFPRLVIHSDCDGGYVGGNFLQVKPGKEFTEDLRWGDLDELKKEVIFLNLHTDSLPTHYKKCWEDFSNDVINENEILGFR